jgi:hypothetical protein
MSPEVKQLIVKHQMLAEELSHERHRVNVSVERMDEIRAEGRAVQFQLLLHMPCHAFFKFFNINREAAL